jgi:ATP-dependent protease ClpP protease subunit
MKVNNNNKIKVVKNQASNVADIYIYDAIGENFDWWTWTVTGVTFDSFSKDLENVKNMDRINIRVNSEGGDVHAGLAIYNLIKRTAHNNIHIYVDGVAYSMAAIIMMAVPKGNRHMATASMLMFHSASTTIYDSMNSTQLQELADVLSKYDDILASALTDSTGLTIDETKAKYFDGKDHFLTPQDALDAGLIADIVDSNIEVFNSIKSENDKKSFMDVLQNFENSMLDKINNLFNNQKPKDMNITDVINALRSGDAITNEQRTELASQLEKFNANKFSQEDIDIAVEAKASEFAEIQNNLEAEKTEKESLKTTVSDLQSKLAILEGGNPPANVVDTQEQNEDELNRFKFKPLNKIRKH